MRVLRSVLILLILVPIFILVLSESSETTRALAQNAAAPNPALVPPAAPGQPAAFPTVGALPSLAPAPGTFRSAVATPVPTPRVFHCTCGGAGVMTSWAGTVPASNYFLADQAASSACVAYKTNSHAPSPYIAQQASPFAAPQTLYNGTAFNSNARVGSALNSTAIRINPVGNAQFAINTQCAHCACN